MKGVWQVANYWETAPTLPLSKLKLEIDELINVAFERDGRIAIGVIFDALIELGFMPCNLYAFLTGFLLKEYSTDTYRYSDGETGGKMSVEKLAEIIGEYVKHTNTPIQRYKDKFIEVMTKEQMAFIDFAQNVFGGIPDHLSVEQTVNKIRSKLKDLGYPIWCFKEIDKHGLDDFIDKLAEIANTNNSGESVTKIADTLGRMSLQIPTAAGNLATLLDKKNAPKAMKEFLSVFENGDIPKIAKEIKTHDILLDVRRQFGTGEALWLWNRETGEEVLRKLLTDYQIVAASNRINSEATSLVDCLLEWQEKIKSMRIPCTALFPKVPALKTMFGYLRDIAQTRELAYDKRAAFLTELQTKGDAFTDFLSKRTAIFQDIYSFYLTGFSEDEVIKLYSSLPMDSFAMDKPEYEKHVEEHAERIRSEQEKYKLHQLWKDMTSSKTPQDWSEKNRTPILSLVPDSLRDDARRAFDTIHRNNPEGAEVKFALEFIEHKASFLTDLNDKAKIDAAFVRDIIGRFVAVLHDVAEVRSHLESVITTHSYDWLANSNVQKEVEKFAQARYNKDGSKKVLKKIDKMEADKAKAYLKRLIKNNMHVGIEIILEEGSEI